MGYFANLYVVEALATDEEVEVRTTIYRSEVGEKAYFCHGSGERPGGLQSYAGGTIFCDRELDLLPGYPLVERRSNDDGCLLESDFTPAKSDDAVLFHFVLPPRFVPRRDREPLDQPDRPIVDVHDDRVIVTYGVTGPAVIRFAISPLSPDDELHDYQLHKLLHPEEKDGRRFGFKLNAGLVELKYD